MGDGPVRAQHERAFEGEAVRQVRAGQAMVVVAKVLGIPRASPDNRVRLAAWSGLGGSGGAGQADRVSPEPMEIARRRAESARLAMTHDSAKAPRRTCAAGHAAGYAWLDPMRCGQPVSVGTASVAACLSPMPFEQRRTGARRNHAA